MQSTAEQEYYEENTTALTLVKNDNTVRKKKEQYYLYYNSGIFPILLFIILFLCVGVILNIGMRIQNLNYNRTILKLNQAISAEKDRSDRLNLKISQLKSPSLIASAIEIKNDADLKVAGAQQGDNAGDDLNINKENSEEPLNNATEFKELDIFYSQTANNMNIAENSEGSFNNYNNQNEITNSMNLGAVASNIRDVLLVVSEGILTFFIP